MLTSEEDDIKKWSIEMSQRGFGQTPDQLKFVVKRLLDFSGRKEKLFKNNLLVKAWWFAFMGRHPELKTVMTEKLEMSQAMVCRPERVREWFGNYKEMLTKFGIVRPSQIYNCDESGFPLQTKGGGKVAISMNSTLMFIL